MNGNIRSAELAKRQRSGSLVISLAAVATEAGCSRTLIGYKNCRYPDTRALIKEAIEAMGGRPSSLRAVRDALFVTLSSLNQRLSARRDAYSRLCCRMGVPAHNAQSFESHLPTQLDCAGPIKQQIKLLRQKARDIQAEIAVCDTKYANLLIRQRLLDRGIRPDGCPTRPATKAERRSSIHVVGKK